MAKPVAVILTDTHKTKDNLALVEDIFDQALKLAIGLGCFRVIHGGDWFTNRVGQNLATLLTMDRILKKADKKGIHIDGIAGNHDKTDQDSSNSYLDVFNYENFTNHKDGGCTFIGELWIGFMPYFTQSYLERLKEVEREVELHKPKHKILITHVAFNGVKNNDGSIVKGGIGKQDVAYWDKVLVGHYHDSSKVGKNIHYIGSAYQNNYGENHTDKGFTVLYDDGSIKHAQSEFPRYIKFNIDVNDTEKIDELLENYSNSEDNIRFIFSGSKTDLDKINLSRFTDVGIDCKFESDEINEGIINVDGDNFKQLDSKLIKKNFISYCKIQGLESDKIKEGLKLLSNDDSSFQQLGSN